MTKPHSLSLLILFTSLSLTYTSKPNTPQTPPILDNSTIYNLSKQLCWGCIADSLEFLYAHNLARAAKWEPPLFWDWALQRHAEWWAHMRRPDCFLQHSPEEASGALGENIFWGGGSAWTPLDAVRAWTEEERFYDYQANACAAGQQCGHYTQVVWSRTRRLGCARVVCDDGDVFMACNYDPPGNYIGEKPY